VWAVTHPAVLGRYLLEDSGPQRVMGAMKNACRDYAVKQRALSRGDESQIDDAWYPLEALKGTGQVASKRGLLHHAFDDESWVSPERGEDTGSRTKRDPAEGNNWLATLADVSSALDKLEKEDAKAHALIEAHFKWGLTYEQVGASLRPAVAKATVSVRMDRAIKKVQNILGGPRPKKEPVEPGWEEGLVGTRRAVSNARARAMTDGAYDE
jgi:hypothetical protein